MTMNMKNILLIVAVFAVAWYIGKKGLLNNVPLIGGL